MITSLLKNSFKQYISYPLYFIGEVLGSVLFPIAINCFFIISIISTTDIKAYTNSGIILYVIISNLTYVVITMDVSREIAKDIKGNGLGQKLLLPKCYFILVIFKALAKMAVRIICVYIPIFTVSIFALGTSNILACMLKAIPFLLYACSISILISILIGLSAFYFTEIWGLKAFISFISYVLSGSLFPFDLTLKSIQKILLLTPFPYISYIPTKIITDSNFLIESFIFIIPLIYIIIFLIISIFIWRDGIKKYQSCGV